MSIKSKREQLLDLIQDKEYRQAFVSEGITEGLAFQIRAMREDRDWTQREMGQRVEGEMNQETISRLEDPNYGSYTLRTLNRLAATFDCGLSVRFVPFSDLVDLYVSLRREDVAVPSFGHDKDLLPASTSSFTVKIPMPYPFEQATVSNTPIAAYAIIETETDPDRIGKDGTISHDFSVRREASG